MKNIAIFVLGIGSQSYLICPKDGVETIRNQLDELDIKYELLLENKIELLKENNKTYFFENRNKIIGIKNEDEKINFYEEKENKKYAPFKKNNYKNLLLTKEKYFRKILLK